MSLETDLEARTSVAVARRKLGDAIVEYRLAARVKSIDVGDVIVLDSNYSLAFLPTE